MQRATDLDNLVNLQGLDFFAVPMDEMGRLQRQVDLSRHSYSLNVHRLGGGVLKKRVPDHLPRLVHVPVQNLQNAHPVLHLETLVHIVLNNRADDASQYDGSSLFLSDLAPDHVRG